MSKRFCLCILVILLSMAGWASGHGGWDFGVGYSRLSLDIGKGEDHDGYTLLFRGSRPIVENAENVRMVFGFRTSFYPGGDAFENAIWNVWMLTPEIGLALHQQLGDSGLFLEPSVTIGAPIATYRRRVVTLGDLLDEQDTTVGWAVRPGVLLGYQHQNLALGVEVSYGFEGIDFSKEASGTHGELYLGFCLRATW
jgi:hypothetical protein